MKSGKVYFVEPVQSHPEFLDAKVRHILSSADVVLFDESAPAQILALTRPSARHHNVGTPGTPTASTPQEIRARLVTYATQGFAVVRLRGEDPAGAQRTKEAADVLRACGIEFEILSADAVTNPENQAVAAGV
jgi:siroheme synthase